MQSERNSALHLFDGLGEVDAEVVVGIEAPGDGDLGLSEVGVDGPSVREHRGNEAVGDPFSAKPFVQFYTTKRVGGDVSNFDAIKLFKISAS